MAEGDKPEEQSPIRYYAVLTYDGAAEVRGTVVHSLIRPGITYTTLILTDFASKKKAIDGLGELLTDNPHLQPGLVDVFILEGKVIPLGQRTRIEVFEKHH